MKVLMVVRDGPQNPASRLRMLDLLPYLERAGHKVDLICWAPSSRGRVLSSAFRLLVWARRADAVLLQRPNQPAWLIRVLRRVNPCIVVDFDDAIWIASDGSFAESYGSRLITAIECSRVVMAGSEYLARWALLRAPHSDVVVMRTPTSIVVRNADETAAGLDLPVVIWIGNPVNFADFPDGLNNALGELVASGRARFVVVSSRPMTSVRGAEYVVWSDQAQRDSLASASIGIMPLRDDERSRGRCGFKAIQYMGAALPVIASDVGVAPELIEDGVSGILVKADEDWANALSSLIEDPSQGVRMGEQGLQWVEHNATHDRAVAVVIASLERAAGA